MTSDAVSRTSLALLAAIGVSVAASQADVVFAPLALAVFIIALVSPLQSWLKRRAPALIALALTMTLTILVMVAFASLAVWGFSRVGRSIISDSGRYQAIYDAAVAWLDSHGVSIAGLWSEHFNVGWLLRSAQQITGRLNTTLTFWIITLVYVIIGLMEVEDIARKVRAYLPEESARRLIAASADTAQKFRKYMEVRTLMSLATGALVWAFALATGLQFAVEWGVIAFALNYIPFIGPFIATLFPTLLAMAQFATWEAAVGVFICLNVIQFVIGSYVEPRVSGAVLAISPLVVLFAVFFWTFLWGLFGSFIGVPIVIAVLTFCEHYPPTQWIAEPARRPAARQGRPSPCGLRNSATSGYADTTVFTRCSRPQSRPCSA